MIATVGYKLLAMQTWTRHAHLQPQHTCMIYAIPVQGTLEFLFKLMISPACCSFYCLGCWSYCCRWVHLLQGKHGLNKVMPFTHTKNLHVAFPNYLTLGWEFECQSLTVTLIYFIIFKNRTWLPQATGREIWGKIGWNKVKDRTTPFASHCTITIRDMHIIVKHFSEKLPTFQTNITEQ